MVIVMLNIYDWLIEFNQNSFELMSYWTAALGDNPTSITNYDISVVV